MQLIAVFTLLLACVYHANAHGAILSATGLNGSKAMAMGVVESTPRDCTKRDPCQQDSSIIRAREIASGKATGCGRTLANGPVNIEQEMVKIKEKFGGYPIVASNSQLTLTLHQVNGDGAGPYTCDFDPTGTAQNFQPLTIVQNAPGQGGNSKKTQKSDQTIIVQMPASLSAADGATGIVRCQNPAKAGPFGGCVPVTIQAAAAQNRPGAAQAAPATPPPAPTQGAAKGRKGAKANTPAPVTPAPVTPAPVTPAPTTPAPNDPVVPVPVPGTPVLPDTTGSQQGGAMGDNSQTTPLQGADSLSNDANGGVKLVLDPASRNQLNKSLGAQEIKIAALSEGDDPNATPGTMLRALNDTNNSGVANMNLQAATDSESLTP